MAAANVQVLRVCLRAARKAGVPSPGQMMGEGGCGGAASASQGLLLYVGVHVVMATASSQSGREESGSGKQVQKTGTDVRNRNTRVK